MGNDDWREHLDDEGFPVPNEDRDGEVFIDANGKTWNCQFVPSLGWCWVHPERWISGELYE